MFTHIVSLTALAALSACQTSALDKWQVSLLESPTARHLYHPLPVRSTSHVRVRKHSQTQRATRSTGGGSSGVVASVSQGIHHTPEDIAAGRADEEQRHQFERQGRMLMLQGKLDLARDTIEQDIALTSTGADMNLSVLLFDVDVRRGDYRGAYAAILPWLERGDKYEPWVQAALVTSLMEQTFPGEREYFTRYLGAWSARDLQRLEPQSGSPQVTAAIAAVTLSNAGDDDFYMDLACQLDPGDPYLLYYQFAWYRSKGELKKALQVFDLAYPRMLDDEPGGYPLKERLREDRNKVAAKLGLAAIR